ncbi:MAG: hypothetical protein M1831_002068 [Alyxoria varia]|nr:MAG: hypothetical protein M1831_002068 [Alyxoria varia]
MAGGSHEPTIHMDPAYVKYSQMQIERYKFFRWNARTTFISILFVGVIPGMFGYMGYVTDVSNVGVWQSPSRFFESTNVTISAHIPQGKWDMRGKRRGNTISEF